MTGLAGRTIKGYTVGDQLGVGGFGAVYRAYQTLLKRDVAIKIILPEHANKPDFVRRFETEAELIARLEHPHIVPIYDFWREPDGAYIIMRYIKGVNIRQKMDNGGSLSETETLHILEQISSALHFSHRHQVVHRDLKPENVLIDDDGNAYLLDFGIAKDLSHTSNPDSLGGGTLMYASPEQLTGEPITPQTDLYSLGLLAYEMLTGNLPHDRTTPHAIKQLQLNETLPNMDHLSQPIVNVLRNATHAQPNERFASAVDFVDAFRDAMQIPHLAGQVESVQAGDRDDIDLINPYKGLMAFQEYDNHNFFGRDALVDSLVQRLSRSDENSRFLAVVGPSGSGKSSVVKAGLLPRIRSNAIKGSQNWFIVEMYPGNNPFIELEAALLRVAVNPPESLLSQLQGENGLQRAIKRILPAEENVQLLLIIDQFEELFTNVDNPDHRLKFIDGLLTAIEDSRSRLHIVVTLRADFYDKPMQYRAFGEVLDKYKISVFPLSSDELREAIVKPVEQIGVALQPGLLETIVNDLRGEPGMLPLLQYTMTQLFERRRGMLLTLESYQNLGGVTGALAQQADEIFEQSTVEQQRGIRQLFLRLVTVREDTENTRRRVLQTELHAIPELDNILEKFGTARLLTFDRNPVTRIPTVEVAHEALIRRWNRLKEWVSDSRDELRIHQNLVTATREWLDNNRDAGFLARDARLDQFEAWAEETQLALSDEEHAFLSESLRARDERKQAELARKAHEAKIAQRAQSFQRAAIVLLVVTVMAIGAGIFAFLTATRAQEAQQKAEIDRQDAELAQATAHAGGTKLAEDVAFFEIQQDRIATLAAGGVVIPVGTHMPEPTSYLATLTQIANLNDWEPEEMVDDFGVPMVKVPPGCFYMGSVASGDDKPHEQCVTEPYWIDKYPVTNVQFKEVTGIDPPSESQGDHNPVDSIMWFDAYKFCELRGGYLPTELQWEYAARGPDSRTYPWGNELVDGVAVYNQPLYSLPVMDEDGNPHRPDGASWVGAIDMSGTVWEWTNSRYDVLKYIEGEEYTFQNQYPYPYATDDGREDPQTYAEYQEQAEYYVSRVARGGSHSDLPNNIMSAIRYFYEPAYTYDLIGFRCARDD